ncbi:MAG TPA: hypothetical protein VLC52_06745 [Anaerolineae bacterium]|nr:hypothetical protein [Anaerolineae bacterium]
MIESTTETLLERIDVIAHELEELRQAVLAQVRPPNGNLTDGLYGALGQGSWDEYDPDLDWQRFSS